MPGGRAPQDRGAGRGRQPSRARHRRLLLLGADAPLLPLPRLAGGSRARREDGHPEGGRRRLLRERRGRPYLSRPGAPVHPAGLPQLPGPHRRVGGPLGGLDRARSRLEHARGADGARTSARGRGRRGRRARAEGVFGRADPDPARGCARQEAESARDAGSGAPRRGVSSSLPRAPRRAPFRGGDRAVSLQALRTPGPGRTVVLSGNEAIARGAMEAGLAYAAAYPGSPSSEVLASLAAMARERGFHAEWSTNENVPMEGPPAAAFAGLRAITIMKADGLNVALDFLTSLAYGGTNGGMVVVVSDDPGAHSSTKEEDTRYLVRASHLPLLEPTTVEEAKAMTRWAFDLSEEIRLPVLLRSVTRIAHARGSVELGALRSPPGEARGAPRGPLFPTR